MEMDLSRFPQGAIKQGYIEGAFLDLLRDEGVLQVERNVVTESISYDDMEKQKHGDYAITLDIAHSDKSESSGTEKLPLVRDYIG